ncbi:MAG: cellulase N-terminal Ig-like domain-containing protein, partial [Muribaculaceae bacterium]|nr:cellulase N-terminal Ig-like domain-containing protein [Muribaculaceae bacterium]
MKKIACFLAMAVVAIAVQAESWIRVNQMGYLPNDIKVAVMIMEKAEDVKIFKVTNTATGKSVKIDKVKQ